MKKLLKDLKEWWYDITSIFMIGFSISLNNFSLFINILNNILGFHLNIPDIFVFGKWKNLFFRAYPITKNKNFEIQCSFTPNLETKCMIISDFHCDHANTSLEVAVFGLEISFTLYDKRHWDYKTNKYKES